MPQRHCRHDSPVLLARLGLGVLVGLEQGFLLPLFGAVEGSERVDFVC